MLKTRRLVLVTMVPTLIAISASARAAVLDPGSFALSSGTGWSDASSNLYTVNTTTDQILLGANVVYTGNSYTDMSGTTYAVFDFPAIALGAGVTLNVTGSNPLALLSRGDFGEAATINLNGSSGITGGAAVAGGGAGAIAGSDSKGSGPGGGGGVAGTEGGGGGGFGGAGGMGGSIYGGGGGGTYGNLTLTLQGGSGGGSGHNTTAGGGGGALELGAGADDTLTLSGLINADGGDGASNTNNSAGGAGAGSGGGILLHGGLVDLTGTLDAAGGAGGSAGSFASGGGGGGGLITVLTPDDAGFVDLGTTDVNFGDGGSDGSSLSETGANGSAGTFTQGALSVPEPSGVLLGGLIAASCFACARPRRRWL